MPTGKNDQTELLARKLAELTGETLTEAVRTAVAERNATTNRECRRDDPEAITLDTSAVLAILTARTAFRRFGKGRHAAGLDFGDCASYALAQWSGEPLLFKGTDFAATDVARARPRG